MKHQRQRSRVPFCLSHPFTQPLPPQLKDLCPLQDNSALSHELENNDLSGVLLLERGRLFNRDGFVSTHMNGFSLNLVLLE